MYIIFYICDGSKKVIEIKVTRVNQEVRETHNHEITSVIYIFNTLSH